MRESTSVVTPATVYPVTVEDLKVLLRITTSDEDTLLADFIEAATDVVEQYLRKTLISTTLKLTLDTLPFNKGEEWWDGVREIAISELHGPRKEIILHRGPVQSITSVVYYDRANDDHTWSDDNYYLDSAGDRLLLNSGLSWPSGVRCGNGLEITYVAGYGATSASVPAAICMAVRRLAAKLYESRGCDCDMDKAMTSSLALYRRMDSKGNF